MMGVGVVEGPDLHSPCHSFDGPLVLQSYLYHLSIAPLYFRNGFTDPFEGSHQFIGTPKDDAILVKILRWKILSRRKLQFHMKKW